MQLGTPHLDALLEDIAKLKEAYLLLEELYLAVGPYNLPEVTPGECGRPWQYRVRDLFKFDDNE